MPSLQSRAKDLFAALRQIAGVANSTLSTGVDGNALTASFRAGREADPAIAAIVKRFQTHYGITVRITRQH